MFNITQLNDSLSRLAFTESSNFGPQRGASSSVESLLPVVPARPQPVVTWRVTRSTNLKGLTSHDTARPELTTAEGLALIGDLAAHGVPRLVFAGGEPLMREDFPGLVAYTKDRGIQPSLLTRGAQLIGPAAAGLKRAGLHSVTILLEGIDRELDRKRGGSGAFKGAMEGYANSEAAGLKTEVRIPLNRGNYTRLAGLLDFVERERIRKVVFAHLVSAGRGNQPQDDLTHEQKRRALDLLLDRAEDLHQRGAGIEISTDENYVDGIYHYLRLARKNPRRAAAALRLLAGCGANVQGAGVGIAGIDSAGGVHPDAYWANCTLGNVRETPFSEIWEKSPHPLLHGLRNRLPLLKGRCGNCLWKKVCGGNLRVRAEEYFGDPWMADPACYLTNNEIGKKVTEPAEVVEDDVLLVEQAA